MTVNVSALDRNKEYWKRDLKKIVINVHYKNILQNLQYMLLIVIIHLAEIRILLKARKQAQRDEGLLRHFSLILSN